MRKIAIVDNGKVLNTIVVSDGEQGDKEILQRIGIDITGTTVGIGWGHDGRDFIKPEPTTQELKAAAQGLEKQSIKNSAEAKLAALGLTPEEISAITGS